jgi:hypothetical protein
MRIVERHCRQTDQTGRCHPASAVVTVAAACASIIQKGNPSKERTINKSPKGKEWEGAILPSLFLSFLSLRSSLAPSLLYRLDRIEPRANVTAADAVAVPMPVLRSRLNLFPTPSHGIIPA